MFFLHHVPKDTVSRCLVGGCGADLKELHDRGEKITRIYLTNGDPFVLNTDRLVKIAELIHQYLPEVEVLTCYASIQNLKAKSLEELKLLKSVGYDELYVGLETAYARR